MQDHTGLLSQLGDGTASVPPEEYLHALLEMLPAAIYATDAVGRIIFYNEAAVALWGHRPPLNKSEFCGSWKLYWPDGRPMAHDECPMAQTLRTRQPVRGQEAIAERPDGTRVPFIPYPTPLFNAAGELIGAVNMLIDITDRRRIEERIRDSEVRYRGLFDNAPIAVWEEDLSAVLDLLDEIRADGVSDPHAWFGARPDRLAEAIRRVRVTDVNDFSLAMFDTRRKEALLGSIADVFLPETEPVFIEQLAALWNGQRRIESETVLRTLTGRRLNVILTMAFGGARAERTLVSILDISGRKVAEQSAQLLAAIVESSEDAIISKDLNGVITTWNSGAQRLFGYAAEETVGRSITILIPPDRLAEETTILERIRRGERIEHFETIRRRKDGSLFDISLSVSPVKDSDGRIVGASKIGRDITERKRAQEQQSLLVREMSHRIKNLFAVTNSVVALSARAARTPAEMADAIQGRLSALTRAHDLTRPGLIVTPGAISQDTSLHAIIHTVLSPYVDARWSTEHERVVVSGPDVPVSTNAITSFALILHEFATNAAKYGSLSVSTGRVAIDCALAGDALQLTWQERGGPALREPPGSEGFGGQLARRIVTGQFGGSVSWDWQPHGLVIRLTLPASRLAG
jgi:PAS domain S-box-containing protein